MPYSPVWLPLWATMQTISPHADSWFPARDLIVSYAFPWIPIDSHAIPCRKPYRNLQEGVLAQICHRGAATILIRDSVPCHYYTTTLNFETARHAGTVPSLLFHNVSPAWYADTVSLDADVHDGILQACRAGTPWHVLPPCCHHAGMCLSGDGRFFGAQNPLSRFFGYWWLSRLLFRSVIHSGILGQKQP